MDNMVEYIIFGIKIWCLPNSLYCFGPYWLRAVIEFFSVVGAWVIGSIVYHLVFKRKETEEAN